MLHRTLEGALGYDRQARFRTEPQAKQGREPTRKVQDTEPEMLDDGDLVSVEPVDKTVLSDPANLEAVRASLRTLKSPRGVVPRPLDGVEMHELMM